MARSSGGRPGRRLVGRSLHTRKNAPFLFSTRIGTPPRDIALKRAWELTRQLLIVAVRTDQSLENAAEFNDGVCTSKGTFQKVYGAQEFHDYVSETLGSIPALVAPGISYVFKDEALKARYVANRAFTRRLEYRLDLVKAFSRDAIARQYVALAGRLGRIPLPEEFKPYNKLVERFGPPRRLERLLLRAVDRQAYEGTQVERRTDILTYLSMLRLEGLRPPPFQALPTGIQADVRELFGGYTTAVESGEATTLQYR